ncbi:hypothetical protein ALC53_06566 [Atta colombica]|uniref:Uncharacterized protein n=1 Tax=Atta colombica TaxID=520822 RepID=A0A195BE46_9HYME|nr:hypothetical protein ALC53_06566 [Atta colombica]
MLLLFVRVFDTFNESYHLF